MRWKKELILTNVQSVNQLQLIHETQHIMPAYTLRKT